ncbi:hypothetical protein M514_03940 [Trichuris suis]|uniref:Uncharacterized protein n=1 Tax=Trichuris suis TaxID=68888 RepID=A0A085N8V9_9BILA|nr:hypothetical protein M513_03940 [Trichuris suis]KFD65905.1 hypothetical protein M514_03940 [Trichuris suis]
MNNQPLFIFVFFLLLFGVCWDDDELFRRCNQGNDDEHGPIRRGSKQPVDLDTVAYKANRDDSDSVEGKTGKRSMKLCEIKINRQRRSIRYRRDATSSSSSYGSEPKR